MKKFRIITTIMLLCFMLLTPITYGQNIESNDGSSVKYDIKTMSSDIIVEASSSLNDRGRLEVNATAYTETLSTVDTLKLNVYLQKHNGSSWSTVKSWSKTNSDDSCIEFSGYYTVSTSGKYRIKVIHKATNNGVTETKTTTTSSITIK